MHDAVDFMSLHRVGRSKRLYDRTARIAGSSTAIITFDQHCGQLGEPRVEAARHRSMPGLHHTPSGTACLGDSMNIALRLAGLHHVLMSSPGSWNTSEALPRVPNGVYRLLMLSCYNET